MGSSGGKGSTSTSSGGAKGWGDVLKATLNPLADFTGTSDPILDAAFKSGQKMTKEGSAGADMLSTWDSREKAANKPAPWETAAQAQVAQAPDAGAAPLTGQWQAKDRGQADGRGQGQGTGMGGGQGQKRGQGSQRQSLLTEDEE